MSNEELKIHISIAKKLEENKQKNRTRVKVTLDVRKETSSSKHT